MSDVSRKRWSAVVMLGFAAVALAVPSFAEAARGAGNAKAAVREGIVQSVSAKAIVLRELDGRTVSVPVALSTHVFVDGKRSSLRVVKAGFVASAAWKTGKPASVLQAFNLLRQNPVSVGVVDSVSPGVLVMKESGGTTVSIPVNAGTRVLLDGKPASLAAVKRGYTVVIPPRNSKSDKAVHELRFLRPV